MHRMPQTLRWQAMAAMPPCCQADFSLLPIAVSSRQVTYILYLIFLFNSLRICWVSATTHEMRWCVATGSNYINTFIRS
ncbi:hypothetical protein B0H13DRAFT_1967131 [Mycena leptocephala]|nr:hypothetical protein B0H13DRAFT_2124842 [Mycena leptocephala]KAJ7872590.1 hypothetical protein B0H13DRAFT_2059214 [Mycena leptocephala]KAJ7928739.1 hypothetical protein B0H13DRAFT_1967131 [Mycena leptocephala]